MTVLEKARPWAKKEESDPDSVQQIMQDHGQHTGAQTGSKEGVRHQLKSVAALTSGFGAMQLKSMAPARVQSMGEGVRKEPSCFAVEHRLTCCWQAMGGEVSAAVLEQGETLRKIERKLEHDMDLTLQCVLQLSKEVRALSHRVKTLTDTAEVR